MGLPVWLAKGSSLITITFIVMHFEYGMKVKGVISRSNPIDRSLEQHGRI